MIGVFGTGDQRNYVVHTYDGILALEQWGLPNVVLASASTGSS